jgi:hypothetical protein
MFCDLKSTYFRGNYNAIPAFQRNCISFSLKNPHSNNSNCSSRSSHPSISCETSEPLDHFFIAPLEKRPRASSGWDDDKCIVRFSARKIVVKLNGVTFLLTRYDMNDMNDHE